MHKLIDPTRYRQMLRNGILGLGRASFRKKPYPELQDRSQQPPRSERLYRGVFNAVNDAIFIHDSRTGAILDVNTRMLEMYRCTREQAIGAPLGDVSSGNIPFTQEYSLERIREAAKGPTQPFEWHGRRFDGDLFWVEVALSPLEIDGRPCTLAVVRDITDRKDAEQERIELEQRMLLAQKIESLGVLAGGIAHDYNNLLMAILGNLELSLKALPPESQVYRSIERAEKAVWRAADLTRQLLTYSGKSRFVGRELDLSLLVEDMRPLLRSVAGKHVALTFDLSDNLPVIQADSDQMQQIILHLVMNASEAVGEGHSGVVRISTGIQDHSAEDLRRNRLDHKLPPGRFVFLEVSDTGCGMSEETQRRLFDPFYTTKFTGRGLGLSALLGIVRGHEGAILVESAVGRGSTFRIVLPLDAPRREKEAECPRNISVIRNVHKDLLEHVLHLE